MVKHTGRLLLQHESPKDAEGVC